MLSRLSELGFTNASEIREEGPRTLYRIRTSRGWVYERFPKDDASAVDRWAAHHEPEDRP